MRPNSEFGIRNSEFPPSPPRCSECAGEGLIAEFRCPSCELPATYPAAETAARQYLSGTGIGARAPRAGREEARTLNLRSSVHVGGLPRGVGRHSEFRIPNSEFVRVDGW